MIPEPVTCDLFAVSSGESCKRLYQRREAQGEPSDGPGKPREVSREGHWEAQEECREDPGRPREDIGNTHGPGRERGREEVKRRRKGKGGWGGSNSLAHLVRRGGNEAFETRLFFVLAHGRRGFCISPPIWSEGGGRRFIVPESLIAMA